ncbi:MAG: AsmA family protein, partial [Bacteroidota bacterium]
MKIIKRIALIFFILFVLIIGVAIAIPIIYQDEMVEVVKEQINTNINATADFAEVDMSLLNSFPHLSLTLTDFSLIGKDQFEGVPFLSAKELAVTINISSFFGADTPMEINAIQLKEPSVNVLVLADGAANYDITIPSDEPEIAAEESATTALEVSLKSYEITDGKIIYDDRSSDIYMAIEGLNHAGTGNFTLTNFDLDTETDIAGLTVKQGGVTFLKEAHTNLAAIFNIDTENSSYTLKDNQLSVNELLLNAEGNIQLLEEDIKLDLAFNSPGSDFRSLWSLIPNAYTADYQDVDIAGTFSLSGLVQGIYNENTYPAFRIQTKVNDGQVKYPDLPLAIQGIQADLDVNSPSSELDKMTVKADRLDLKVGSDAFKSKFQISTPISDPNVSAQVDGVMDLAQWAKAFPLDGVQEMVGRIIADVDVQTRLSTIEQERYEDVKMAGDVKVSQLRYAADGLPLVVIENAAAQFTPQAVKVEQFEAQLGKSDISASGSIDNILAYISPEKTMKGNFTAHTNYFLVDEWMEEEAETVEAIASPTAEEESTEIFDRFDFQLDATASKIVYDAYELTTSSLTGRVKPNLVEITDVKTKIGESDLQGSGTVTNGFDYAFSDGVLGGNLNVRSNFFDLNPFMEEPEGEVSGTAATEDEEFGVIPIPANIAMTINTQIDRLRYTDMELKDLTGKMTIEDQVVVLEEGSAKMLGGSMDFTGAY